MKRFLIILALLLAGILAFGFMYRDSVWLTAMSVWLRPSDPFDQAMVPKAPDYSKSESWAALPDRLDNADFTPPGVFEAQDKAAVDVFFIHPTTYYTSDHWNQPLDDAAANEFTDQFVLKGQASAFNGSARVYAPRYRQATLYSFMDDSGSGAKALDVAYRDVKAAFDYYLEELSDGRPFILAGHSQGARHLEKLLAERVSGTELMDRLVAAYPVGWPINTIAFAEAAPDIPLCTSPNQTGCYATWNSLGPKGRLFADGQDIACVNPLTWTKGGAYGRFESNLGGVTTVAGGALHPGAADAQCDGGRLIVTDIRSEGLKDARIYMGRQNYHVLDYALFYMNIRDNVHQRVTAYLKAQPAEETALSTLLPD